MIHTNKHRIRGGKYYRSDAGRDRSRRARKTRTGISGFMPMLMLAGFFGAGMLYVAQMNSAATGSLMIRDMQHKISQLTSQNQEMELKADTVRSLSNVEESSTKLDLVAQAQVQYLDPSSSAVAVAK